jgi:uncharacterized protein
MAAGLRMKRLHTARRSGRLRRYATPVKAPTNCLRCGVCCFSKLETYVRVSGDDWTRLGDAASRVAHFIGHRAYMKMAGEHCAALELRSMPQGGTEFFCSVYEQRPQVCRDLARGSPQCAGERELKSGRIPA